MSKERNVKIILSAALLTASCAVAPMIADAQEKLPEKCFRDGYIDIAACGLPEWELPNELLVDGYYGMFGRFVPALPLSEMNNVAFGNYISGSLTYMTTGKMPGIVEQKAKKWGLDSSQYVGGIALETCGQQDVNAWIRRKGSSEDWYGPLLVDDCTSLMEKPERACIGLVGEVGYETFSLYQKSGRLDDMEVFLKSIEDLTSPPGQIDTPAVNYAEEWLKAAGFKC